MFWHGETGAVHYGFRDESTRTHRDELLNTNRFLARMAGIRAGERVLDAGCGVGGSATWLAENIGATVVGITLSRRQAVRAAKILRARRLDGRVAFQIGDYCATAFKPRSFDVVWGLESVCYAANKSDFLSEAFRLLVPGGRIVVGDGFVCRPPQGNREIADYRAFLKMALPGLAGVGEFEERMRNAGFASIRVTDQTPAATPSSIRLFRMCAPSLPVARALEAARITPRLLTDNIRAGIAQYRLLKRGVLTYNVFCGERSF